MAQLPRCGEPPVPAPPSACIPQVLRRPRRWAVWPAAAPAPPQPPWRGLRASGRCPAVPGAGAGGQGVGPAAGPPPLFPGAWAEREENFFLAWAPGRSVCQPRGPAHRRLPRLPSVRHGQSLRPPLQVAAHRGLGGGQDLSDHSLCRGQLQQHLHLHHR